MAIAQGGPRSSFAQVTFAASHQGLVPGEARLQAIILAVDAADN